MNVKCCAVCSCGTGAVIIVGCISCCCCRDGYGACIIICGCEPNMTPICCPCCCCSSDNWLS